MDFEKLLALVGGFAVLRTYEISTWYSGALHLTLSPEEKGYSTLKSHLNPDADYRVIRDEIHAAIDVACLQGGLEVTP